MLTRRGLSMMEVVISIALVGIVVAGGLRAGAQSARAAGQTRDAAMAAWLADELMAEMMTVPAFGDSKQGPEVGEVGASRNAWDDLSDYHGLSESPPVNQYRTPYAGTTGWRRRASVHGATAVLGRTDDLTGNAWIIVVEVGRDGETLATRTAVRTRAMEDAP